MKRILIIGSGAFGKRAADVLYDIRPDVMITVVDRDAALLHRFNNRSVETVCKDGISFLAEKMTDDRPPDWIVPAIPKHVAYEWMRVASDRLFSMESVPVPAPVFNMLPNPIRGKNGEVYTSNADFLCPDDCPEPKTICTVTGKPRPRALHSYLETITYRNFRSVVVTSRQLAPGAGGYTPKALRDALTRVKAAHTPVLLSTACKCHGVVHAVKIRLK
jgi:hypothetical protein